MRQRIQLEIIPYQSIGGIDLYQSREFIIRDLINKLTFSHSIEDEEQFLAQKGIKISEDGKLITFYDSSLCFVELTLFGRLLLGASYREVLDWVETISNPTIHERMGFRSSEFGMYCFHMFGQEKINEISIFSRQDTAESINLELIPYVGLGPIQLGKNREEVLLAIESTIKYSNLSEYITEYDANSLTYDYLIRIGIIIAYSSDNKCESITINNESDSKNPYVNIIYNNKHLIGLSFRKIILWLESIDSHLIRTDTGVTSLKLGINISDSCGIDLRYSPESITVFCRGYNIDRLLYS
ncbi:MAG: hypothetical protein HC921_20700 [Synechococcaceae cyanobacterium SM2_3_1]|nr:hypothetical protein [Synechococcaceae cyanobacterium SM2_3_1]